MEGEPLWYKLEAMAFTFGIYFPTPLTPTCADAKEISDCTKNSWVTVGRAHRIPVSEMKTLSLSVIGRHAEPHWFKH